MYLLVTFNENITSVTMSGGPGGENITINNDEVKVAFTAGNLPTNQTCYTFDFDGTSGVSGDMDSSLGDTTFCVCYHEANINGDAETNSGDKQVIKNPNNWKATPVAAQDGAAPDVNRDGQIDAGDTQLVANPNNWKSTHGVCP